MGKIYVLLFIFLALVIVDKLFLSEGTKERRRKNHKRNYYDDYQSNEKVNVYEFSENRRPNDDLIKEADVVYQRRDFLSNAEMDFFQVLRQACGSDYYIAPKVGLWGLVQGEKTEYGNERGWAKISQKHLDFVLLNPRMMNPVLVVELDDSSHWRAERRAKDEQKDAILRQANIPILRVPVRASYDANKLKESVYAIIRSFYLG